MGTRKVRRAAWRSNHESFIQGSQRIAALLFQLPFVRRVTVGHHDMQRKRSHTRVVKLRYHSRFHKFEALLRGPDGYQTLFIHLTDSLECANGNEEEEIRRVFLSAGYKAEQPKTMVRAITAQREERVVQPREEASPATLTSDSIPLGSLTPEKPHGLLFDSCEEDSAQKTASALDLSVEMRRESHESLFTDLCSFSNEEFAEAVRKFVLGAKPDKSISERFSALDRVSGFFDKILLDLTSEVEMAQTPEFQRLMRYFVEQAVRTSEG